MMCYPINNLFALHWLLVERERPVKRYKIFFVKLIFRVPLPISYKLRICLTTNFLVIIELKFLLSLVKILISTCYLPSPIRDKSESC